MEFDSNSSVNDYVERNPFLGFALNCEHLLCIWAPCTVLLSTDNGLTLVHHNSVVSFQFNVTSLFVFEFVIFYANDMFTYKYLFVVIFS